MVLREIKIVRCNNQCFYPLFQGFPIKKTEELPEFFCEERSKKIPGASVFFVEVLGFIGKPCPLFRADCYNIFGL
jgi:molybdenum cofactor biosynthesis enzyme MoaA